MFKHVSLRVIEKVLTAVFIGVTKQRVQVSIETLSFVEPSQAIVRLRIVGDADASELRFPDDLAA